MLSSKIRWSALVIFLFPVVASAIIGEIGASLAQIRSNHENKVKDWMVAADLLADGVYTLDGTNTIEVESNDKIVSEELKCQVRMTKNSKERLLFVSLSFDHDRISQIQHEGNKIRNYQYDITADRSIAVSANHKVNAIREDHVSPAIKSFNLQLKNKWEYDAHLTVRRFEKTANSDQPTRTIFMIRSDSGQIVKTISSCTVISN